MSSLLSNAIPPKPSVFSPEGAPVGVAIDFNAYRTSGGSLWWPTRPYISPRLQLAHTNAAEKEGSVQSAINWGNNAPYENTHCHYAFNKPVVTKLIPTNRRGIGNATTSGARGSHGNVTDWSLVYETADTGTLADPGISDFMYDHAEIMAQVFAYESIVHGIPLSYPSEWYGAGSACHTEPFGYPYWTIKIGKICPGSKKKATVRNEILPRANQIRAAWLGEEEDMFVELPTQPRWVDTRWSGWNPLEKNTDYPIPRHASVPTNATSVVVNITAVNPVGTGYLQAWAAGGNRPESSKLNYKKATAPICNEVTVPCDNSGITLRVSAKTDVLLDLAGYYVS